MKVEIWSDVVCPWCYIGKRRFESALAQFAHRDQVEVIWRSYRLDPHAPRVSEQTVHEMLAEKYGVSLTQAAAMNDRVSRIAAQEGLEYHLERARHANTFDAHRLIHLAAAHGQQHTAEEAFFNAYFTEGEDLGDAEALVRIVADAGIDAEEARAVLVGQEYAAEVEADVARAGEFGIQGVPFYVIDETYGISGAQPGEVFAEVLEQAWEDAHPHTLKMHGHVDDAVDDAADDTANQCEGGNCAIA
jgi:predicted DsbA family dithiol-disulfide isomerase